MQNPFSSITTAGLLLPLDLLTRVSSMDRALPGMTSADYHVPGSIRLNEAATAAYSRALAHWKSFRKRFNALPASDTGTTITRDEWLLPLFDCLGYGRLQNKRAVTIDSKDYPISHGWEDHVPIHLLSARLPLDKRTQNVSGAATRSPYSLVQELINRSAKHRWGFVSNGLKLYVLRDNASLTRSANIEFDLETMMDGEYHADFTVLFLICHQSRLEIQPTPIVDTKGSGKKAAKPAKAKQSESKVREKLTNYALDLDDEAVGESELGDDEEAIEIEEPTRLGPENCWLEVWTKLAGEQGTRAKERLRGGVQLAIQTLGAGFYTCASNTDLHERLRSGQLPTQDYYRQLLRMVYRLLMVMVAEDKRTESGQNLLHPIDTPPHIRDRYNQFYSIGRIRRLANERRGSPHRDLFESLKTLFMKLRDGYAPLGIPGIGSFLFSDTATPDIDNAQITNEDLLDAFRHLCFTDDATGRGGSIRRAVDFGNLGSEELGSIYESLLELHPEIDSQDGPFVLRTAAGNERKTSGSYYTPTSLINCLLDSALDPVVNQAIDVPDREEAKRRLLDLKVCDPACGSGHFLIAAANRMALHLARLETQDTEPTTLQIQHAKRQIIGRCIYGVDINEMAVELCKVSLWMEALEPGKPFSFLENHIKCGNSLLGATPRLLNEGIPDEAFSPIEGDDKTVCSQLKKDNKRERVEHKSGQRYIFEPFFKLGNMADRFAKLSAADDESLDAITDKQKQYEELVKGTPYLNARFWADTWCAVFVWNKVDNELGRICPTERKFREIERSPHSASSELREEVKQLADQFQFFHWHLAFPEIFSLPKANEAISNTVSGWDGGFDAVLGNPPWEKVKLQEREYFAVYDPEIATARTAADRKRFISIHRNANSTIWSAYSEELGRLAKIANYIRCSGRFPFTSGGDINTYSLFAELVVFLLSSHGRAGQVLKTGIVNAKENVTFFTFLTSEKRIASVRDFKNWMGWFPGIGYHERFSLVTFTSAFGAGECEYAFNSVTIDDAFDPERVYSLSDQDIRLMNPNVPVCPVFSTRKDAELTRLVYAKFQPLVNEHAGENPWLVKFSSMFHMTSDSGKFLTLETLVELGVQAKASSGLNSISDEYVPLLEGKHIQSLTHRFASYEGVHASHRFGIKAAANTPTLDQLFDPAYEPLPRYWVRKSDWDNQCPNEIKMAGWCLAFRDITNVISNTRTTMAAACPAYAFGNSVSLLTIECDEVPVCLFLGTLNAFAFDYFARQKLFGSHLNKYILFQLPMPRPESFRNWSLESSVGIELLIGCALELSFNTWSLKNYAKANGYDGPPFCWDDMRRFLIRCELDAVYFHLYLGTKSDWVTANAHETIESGRDSLAEMFDSPQCAISYILDSFPIVRSKDETKYGEYLTKRVILEYYERMAEIIEANEAIRAANSGKSEEQLRPLLRSYQSPLTPPPGPPTDADGNFIPYADWTDEIHRQYAGVIHPPKRTVAEWPKVELLRDLLLVLEAWQKPASISAIEPALLLMRDDRARAVLSGRESSNPPLSSNSKPIKLEGIEAIYFALEANKTIEKVGATGFRLAKPELIAQVPDTIKVKAREAVAIVDSFNHPEEASRAIGAQASFDFQVTN